MYAVYNVDDKIMCKPNAQWHHFDNAVTPIHEPYLFKDKGSAQVRIAGLQRIYNNSLKIKKITDANLEIITFKKLST